MSNSQQENTFLDGIWAPWPAECNINDVVVIGEIPKELNGTFYRNGPNPQYIYSKNYHMFEGDGMIHAVSFNNGQVRYKNRWIRTEKFLAERNARKSLFGGMRDFMVCDDSVKNVSRNTANTNVIWHHNTLLALNEGGQPVKVDINDLTQCENYTFNQVLDSSMMAHPKIDPVTGELLFYSYFGPKTGVQGEQAGFQVVSEIMHHQDAIETFLNRKGRFILATNDLDTASFSDQSMLQEYKQQQDVERGFRFLKDPWFMVDSVFLKSPKRIEALMMVMTLCLMIYNVAQYRLREALIKQKETLPNQINKPIQNPTLRWIFQIMEGISIVRLYEENVRDPTRVVIANLNDLRIKIINLFGRSAQKIYGIA